MTILAFDTLKAARKLGKAGFNEVQIDSLPGIFAEALTENLATKDDIERLDEKIDGVATRLDTKIDTVAEGLRKDMTIRLGTIVVATAAIFQAIDHFFFSPFPV